MGSRSSCIVLVDDEEVILDVGTMMMEDLKLLLIDRLKSKGMDNALIPAFLKALTYLISSEPKIDPAHANRKMHSLGWDEVTVDYHCLQIVIACLEAETQ